MQQCHRNSSKNNALESIYAERIVTTYELV